MIAYDIRALLPEHIQDLENIQRIRDSVFSEHDVSNRDDALFVLAWRLEGEWLLDEAIETLEHVEEISWDKAITMAGIAAKYTILGSIDHARDLLISAAKIARSLPYRNEAAHTLLGIAELAEGAMSLKSRVGLLLEARDAALEDQVHGDRQESVDAAKTLARIAVGLALLRQEAKLCAEGIKYEQYRASALSRIGAIEQRRERSGSETAKVARAKPSISQGAESEDQMRESDIRRLLPEHIQDLDNVQRIRDFVLSEHDVDDRDDALLVLAERLEGEWLLDEAIETLEHTEEIPGHKATTMAGIAGKYITLGSFDHARDLLISAAQIARSLPYRDEAAYTLLGIAEFAEGAMSLKSRVGLLLEARDAALEDHIHGDRQESVDAAKTLAKIAVGLALLRQDKEAKLCADSIKYERYRASALSRIGAIEQRRE